MTSPFAITKEAYPSYNAAPLVLDLAEARMIAAMNGKDGDGDLTLEVDWKMSNKAELETTNGIPFNKEKDRDKCFADMNLQIFAGKRVEYIP